MPAPRAYACLALQYRPRTWRQSRNVEQASHELAAKLAGADDNAKKQASLNRSVSCKLRDLNVIFLGELNDGQLTDIRPGPTARTRRCACQ